MRKVESGAYLVKSLNNRKIINYIKINCEINNSFNNYCILILNIFPSFLVSLHKLFQYLQKNMIPFKI
jgi:hypothetical protein